MTGSQQGDTDPKLGFAGGGLAGVIACWGASVEESCGHDGSQVGGYKGGFDNIQGSVSVDTGMWTRE